MPQPFVLTSEECRRLLSTVAVGRVGVTMGALPVVLPVQFALHDGDVVFQTVQGTSFHAASTDAVAAFEADSYASDGSSGWSVLVQGRSQTLTDAADLDQLRPLFTDRWTTPPSHADRIIRIHTSLVRGRRYERNPD